MNPAKGWKSGLDFSGLGIFVVPALVSLLKHSASLDALFRKAYLKLISASSMNKADTTVERNLTMPNKTLDPAFPCDRIMIASDGEKPAFVLTSAGMSMRDYFAAKAMAAILQDLGANDLSPEYVSEWAYRHADAMLRASGSN